MRFRNSLSNLGVVLLDILVGALLGCLAFVGFIVGGILLGAFFLALGALSVVGGLIFAVVFAVLFLCGYPLSSGRIVKDFLK